MNPHATRAAELEEAFLAGAETNLNQARGRRLRGTGWTWTTRSQEDRIRTWLADHRPSDREILRSMPKNKTRILTGTQRSWLFRQRRTSVAMASVLSPIEHYLREDTRPPPVGLADLVAHVKDLVGEAEVPHLVGVCSPGGFTEEARAGGLELPNLTLVLIEPRRDGGWTVVGASPNATSADGRLFDPEATTQKLKRVREEIESRGVDLLTSGLRASAIGDRLGLPARLVMLAFEQAASAQPELKLSRQGDDMLLFRGAPAAMENDEMSMIDRLRQLFTGEGDEAGKINVLTERRAKLMERRDRIYADLSQLEKREAVLLKDGREASSSAVKRRTASQIKQLRDDMNRLNVTASMLGQQVEVISTHIHNLTLIQQGQTTRLPTQAQVAEDAVRAEELLEKLGGDAELAGSLSTGVSSTLTSDEELAILQELEAAPPGREAPKPPAPAPPVAEPEPAPEKKEPQRPEPEAG